MAGPGKNKGTNNFKNRLSEEDVIKIYKDTTHRQTELADMYGVNQSTINHIKRGRTWKWLTEGLDNGD